MMASDPGVHIPVFKDAEQLRVGQQPALTASARPLTKWRRGKVARVSASTITSRGCQKAPTTFLVSPRSTAVLPPMEESIMDRVVVGAVDKVDASHIDGGGKARQVAHHAAAHRDDQVAPAQPGIQHLLQHALEGLQLLLASPWGHRDDGGLPALVGHWRA